jgi:hypothetical protein
VSFQRSDYEPDYICSYYDTPSVFDSSGCIQKNSQSNTKSTILYDRWITTVINYDSNTGILEVDYENDGIQDFLGTVSTLNRFKVTRIAIGTYGWYTDHYHSIDSVKVENVQ